MSKVDELIMGTKGKVFFYKATITDLKGKVLYQFDKKKENQPYQAEHDVLFAAIANGEYKFWDTERGAKSTMTSILGRMATYSGQLIAWDKAISSGISIQPQEYAWNAKMPNMPDEQGLYAVAVPGVTKYDVAKK